jgi:hypothetical protein
VVEPVPSLEVGVDVDGEVVEEVEVVVVPPPESVKTVGGSL